MWRLGLYKQDKTEGYKEIMVEGNLGKKTRKQIQKLIDVLNLQLFPVSAGTEYIINSECLQV